MKEWIAFLLPPATAFAGMRMGRLILGAKWEEQFGLGLRFTLGLAIGMLVFSQSVLLAALAGINASGLLAWSALIWGVVEAGLLMPGLATGLTQTKYRPAHLWLLLLVPVVYSWWVFGQLCTLEGTLEFDANAFWVFKAKIIYLEQGKNLLKVMHDTSLAYAHIDYPMLVPGLYALDYGALGGVDEFVNKVWPFWMVVALSLGILSLGDVWRRPHPLAPLLVVLFCFLPGTLEFIRQEGGTMPLVFYASLPALLIAVALFRSEVLVLAAAVLALVGSATAKLEGVIYCAVWGCALLPIIWRRGWLKEIVLWKAVVVGCLCLLPYALYRFAHPITHPADNWWQEYLSAPATMLHRLPRVWFLNVFCRFFDTDFSHWSADSDGKLQWLGHWTGFGSLVNPELSVLPWLLLVLAAFTLWKKPGRGRLTVICLSLVTLGVFTALSIVSTGYLSLQAREGIHHFGEQIVGFSGSVVGRYFYPFVTACSLGIATIWLIDRTPRPPPSPVATAKKTGNAPSAPAGRQSKRYDGQHR